VVVVDPLVLLAGVAVVAVVAAGCRSTIVVAVVVVVGGMHVAVWSGLPFGGGSLGLPAPCGWKRHPSTTSAWTRAPPGPTFEYSQLEPVPCQYDQ
jgi:hypothetical protein